MNTVLYILVITALAGVGGTGLGSILSCLFKKDSNRIVSLLLSFAAGVMLAVVCFDLLSEALIESGVFLVIAGLSFGYIIIGILNAIIDSKTNKEVAHIDKSHPKTADSLEELTHANHLQEHMEGRQPRSGLFIAGLIMAAAIALHNVPEGIVIGSSFAKSAKELVLDRAGITMAIVIGLHNIPEGMAVAVPLISGGMSKFKAVLVTALTGSPTI
ncbi:MAG: ZIP family metal transporter, partial [Erysipelotrichaceae bacterium]|nr:ZIP family metal transporter [Erysipelotrichaceae bacterium]